MSITHRILEARKDSNVADQIPVDVCLNEEHLWELAEWFFSNTPIHLYTNGHAPKTPDEMVSEMKHGKARIYGMNVRFDPEVINPIAKIAELVFEI